MANDSFENAGEGKGLASQWTVVRLSEEEELFAFDGETNFQTFEDFESQWKLPNILVERTNGEALFAFDPSDLEVGLFSGDDQETFETSWSIEDVLGSTLAEQQDQVTTDGGLWPTGHIGFIDSLDLVLTEQLSFSGDNEEDFEASWLLPGSLAGKTNGAWLAAYFDGSEYRFLNSQLDVFLFDPSDPQEDFEANWKSNENSKFAFTGPDLEDINFDGGTGNPEEFNQVDWILILP